MTEIAMRRQGASLYPVDEIAADELRNAVREGGDVLVTTKSPRNIRQHRLAWALADKVADATDLFDREDAMDLIKIKARHFRAVVDPKTGQVHCVPKSIAFASCKQDVFNRLFNRMVWIVCNEIVPGLDEGDLRREIETMTAPREWRKAA